jgi:ribosomal-protein-alanine N-acetyltransferase
MPTLELLSADHDEALLTFERENRAFFAAVIPDRGDDFFARFDEILAERIAEQDTGACRFHLLVDDEGAVLGRFNLVDIADGEAELGYRMAEHATGRGLATAAVAELCVRAATEYGLTRLRARTTLANAASRTVLARNAFTPGAETELNGKPARTYTRLLDVRPPAER